MKKQIVFSVVMILTLFLASCGYTKVQKTQDTTQNVGSKQQEKVMNDSTTVESMEKDMMKGDKDSMEKMDNDEKGMMKKEDESPIMEEKETMMKEDKNDDSMMEKTKNWEEDAMDKDEKAIVKDEAMMKKEAEVMKWSYTAYAENMLGKTDNTVIFFHAGWCPSCRAADDTISWEVIPENLTLLKADYDSEIALRKKYGVVSQHTFVQVDANGDMIKKWAGGTSVKDIEERL